MFVRIRFPVGPPHPALLVIERAIGSDQGIKFVYVVDPNHKAQYRKVTPGALQDDGLRAIDEGLNANDWVVIGGLQQVQPRMEIQTEETTMPMLETPTEKAAPAPAPTAPASTPSKN
jgi:multidrug efflux system membrane fusion protein